VLVSRKRLVVNADDFGLHESINEAVDIAHNKGILTSASLMVNGESFGHAVDIAKKNKNLGVGIHLTLNGEEPISPIKKISSIVDNNGKLLEDHRQLCKKILMKKISLKHIAIECEAQINRFFQAGLTPTHVDSHRHLHLFPPIFKILTPIFKRHNIKKIRWINTPRIDYCRINISKVVFLLFMQYTRFLKDAEYKHPDYFVGFFRSGNMDAGYLRKILFRLKPGITEINFHPGKNDNLIAKKYGFWEEYYKWGCNWEKEFELLLNFDIKKIIKSNNISLISYSEI